MELSYYMLTSVGGRDHNEDCIGMAEAPAVKIFALADGLGGHGKGEVASALAVEAVKSLADSYIEGGAELWLSAAFTTAQNNVIAAQDEANNHSGMKTTLCVLAVEEDSVQWGHIGDSRVYLFKRGRYNRRTADHSVPQMLVAAGEIKEKEIRHHPDRNRLLRVIGSEWETPKYEITKAISASRGDSFLLCSDGFWELIEEKTMEKLLHTSETPEEWVKAMAEEVERNGKAQESSMDNYSAIAVWLR